MQPYGDFEKEFFPTIIDRIGECLFKEHEVIKVLGKPAEKKESSKDNATGKKLRRNQRHKRNCREVAQKLWEEHPEMTIAGMIKRQEMINACERESYSKKTLHDWIKDLSPDRSPGRRPKKNK